MIFTDKQLAVFKSTVSQNYLQKITNRIRDSFPEFEKKSPNNFCKDIKLVVKYSRTWGLQMDNDVVKLAYLILSYESGNFENTDPEIIKLMTWPNRSVADKLEYLHKYLIKKHYGAITGRN